MNKIVRVFLDTNMACQHPGLRALALKHKIRLEALKDKEHVIFVNKARNRVKLYSSNGVISYLWKEKGRLDMMALAMIPETFTNEVGVGFTMDRAIEASLIKRLEASK